MNHTIAILLSTYNGEKYLEEQFNSLEKQTYRNLEIYIRDDGSVDKTLECIAKYIQNSRYNVSLLESRQNLGAMKSFEILLEYVVDNFSYEYFMFCDQDDVWLNNKVQYTFEKMLIEKKNNRNLPILIYTDLEVVDENLNVLSTSMWKYFNLNPNNNTFSQLLMQCNITGCTFMLNYELAKKSLPFNKGATMHDHWIGLVASCFGKVAYVKQATIKYRQHSLNVSGGAEKFNIQYIIKKALKYFNSNEFDKVLGRQVTQANAFFEQYHTELSLKDVEMLDVMIKLESFSLFKKIYLINKYNLYKHGYIRNIGLFMWLLKMKAH